MNRLITRVFQDQTHEAVHDNDSYRIPSLSSNVNQPGDNNNNSYSINSATASTSIAPSFSGSVVGRIEDKKLSSTSSSIIWDGTSNNRTNHHLSNLNITLPSLLHDVQSNQSNMHQPMVDSLNNPMAMNTDRSSLTQQAAVMIEGNSSANHTSHPPSDWLDMPKLDNLAGLFCLSCSLAVIFGGLVPYIPQYLKILKSRSSEGFSTYVCLTLLIANILRIAFWFGHHFELPLLIQSFVMIAGMMAMMEICVRVRSYNSTYIISSIGASINADARNFWDWDDLLSYVKFLSLFTVTLSLVTYLLLNNNLYVETLGFVAVFTESMLGTPQLLRNYLNKSTRGMSLEMVVMWFSGDLFKTLYFILRHAPVQFIACGAIQVLVDILILFQVFLYRKRDVTYCKLPKST